MSPAPTDASHPDREVEGDAASTTTIVAETRPALATSGARGRGNDGPRTGVETGGRGGAGDAVSTAFDNDGQQWDLDDDGGTTLRRLTYAIIALSILILLWKLHAFKLPTEIAAEQAQKAGKAAPSPNRLDTILNWITPWRWGRGDLLKNTTPTGGDMGAHVFTPDFVRNVLLPKGRLTGWTDSSYAGMPVLNFYFPLPSILIALLSFVLPYGIAFKLVTLLGVVTLPVAAYKAGRLALLRPPVPTLMSLAGVIFVLSRNYDAQIYGGNILSTMAGEFSFSIGLSGAMLFLGLYVRALRTGQGRGRAGVMLALTGLCHLLPTLFALIAAFFLLMAHLDPKRLRPRRPDLAVAAVVGAALVALLVAVVNTMPHAVIAAGLVLGVVVVADWLTGFIGLGQLRDAFLILATGGAIAGFWVLPFMVNLPYSNDMGWEKMTKYIPNLFPFWAGKGAKPYPDAGIIAVLATLALFGALGAVFSVAGVLRRHSEKTLEWNPTVMPAGVIVGSVSGLVLALVTGNAWSGLLIGIGIVAFTFVGSIAAAESIGWKIALLGSSLLTALVTVRYGFESAKTPIVLILWGTVLLARAANTGLRFYRWPAAFTLVMASIATLFRFSPQFRLWNARALPFWFFSMGLLAAFGATEVPRLIGAVVRRYATPKRAMPGLRTLGVEISAALVFVAVGLPLRLVPGNIPIPDIKDGRVGVKLAKSSTDSNPAPGWAGYNFAGYEARNWAEYKALMDTMNQVGATNGCGRAMWEYEDSKLNSFGTTLSLMLLPYWTHQCIGSMEAVYFESSATAPSHWLTAAMVTAPAQTNTDGSKKTSGPSNPQRWLRYPPITVENYPGYFATGIKKLQNAGVRYYIAMTELTISIADVNTDLRKVAASGPFAIYEILDSERVAALPFEPVVVTGIDKDQRGGWLDVEQEWFLQTDNTYPSTIAWSGPKSWQRMAANVKKIPGDETVGQGVTVSKTQARALQPVTVSSISQNNTDIRFTVDKVGVPVLVKTSYFPNWSVSGAKGPYRVMPNFMVVIPTSTKVHLHYGYSVADMAGFLITFAGVATAYAMHRRTRRDLDASLADPGPGSHRLGELITKLSRPLRPISDDTSDDTETSIDDTDIDDTDTDNTDTDNTDTDDTDTDTDNTDTDDTDTDDTDTDNTDTDDTDDTDTDTDDTGRGAVVAATRTGADARGAVVAIDQQPSDPSDAVDAIAAANAPEPPASPDEPDSRG